MGEVPLFICINNDMMTQKKNMVSSKYWGEHDGKQIMLFKIENEHGAYIELTNYGATLVSVFVPDKHEELDNVILGYPSLNGYQNDTCYLGSTIGRFANRIANANFMLDGVEYKLDKNDGANSNHGGKSGFHAKAFDYTIDEDRITFTLFSKDGEGGYPGNLNLNVEYSWNEQNELSICYTANADKKTVMNFTNHAYFKLFPKRDDIFSHKLTIHSSRILEITKDYIPTGGIVSTGDKSFKGNKIYDRIDFVGDVAKGLNIYYIFDKDESGTDHAQCKLKDDSSGRVLEIFTTYPGVQLYTGDFLKSESLNNRSSFHKPFDGLCLECQYYPDSPNHKHFPSTAVDVGEVFDEKIVYRFSVEQ
ncbi:MAG TPA: aldose epimerase family protein [Cyclobacteriaceae bacterium]|nr:aldose epimerase family protein [Cyclobacteriaceae bacterium]